MADRAGLENRSAARYRGFESLPLRQFGRPIGRIGLIGPIALKLLWDLANGCHLVALGCPLLPVALPRGSRSAMFCRPERAVWTI